MYHWMLQISPMFLIKTSHISKLRVAQKSRIFWMFCLMPIYILNILQSTVTVMGRNVNLVTKNEAILKKTLGETQRGNVNFKTKIDAILKKTLVETLPGKYVNLV